MIRFRIEFHKNQRKKVIQKEGVLHQNTQSKKHLLVTLLMICHRNTVNAVIEVRKETL